MILLVELELVIIFPNVTEPIVPTIPPNIIPKNAPDMLQLKFHIAGLIMSNILYAKSKPIFQLRTETGIHQYADLTLFFRTSHCNMPKIIPAILVTKNE